MSNNYKPDEICSALRLFFKPGDVFEVRALGATTAGYRREHPESGYFDHEHINDIPKALHNISARGVYFTPNPVNPTLLARAANRMKPAAKDSSTSDGDIVSRRWFLIDCDPIRAAGISATDEEHNLAIEKAKEVRAGLKSMDWPDPILLDSGNGAQLMYHVDLPTGDNGLIKSCLKALASTGDERVQIDQTVHNPARIWRLPGTKNRKGDEIAGRMHRMAKILEIPEKIEIVPEEKLRALIRQKEVAAPITAPTNTTFNLNDWISKYCPDAKGPEQWKDGRKWVFPVCPFNSAHDNSSAVITQQAGGAIGFKCHHNGCIKNDWHALRRLREPGTIPATLPDVDISGITRQIKAQSKIPKEDIAKDPGPMPEELLHVPGFIDEVMNYTLRTAPYPNKILAFAGALSLQAFLAGRKIMDNIRNLTNIYLIALADSGTGKEHPRLVNREIVIAAGLAGKIGDAFASGEGIEDIMYINHAMLFQTDEIDSLLMSVGNIKDVRIANIVAVLLKMFSASASTYDLRIKAGDKSPRFISKPSLTLFGTAVPEYFYGALNPKMLQDGLMARSIVIGGLRTRRWTGS